jgi:hypothetical protein
VNGQPTRVSPSAFNDHLAVTSATPFQLGFIRSNVSQQDLHNTQIGKSLSPKSPPFKHTTVDWVTPSPNKTISSSTLTHGDSPIAHSNGTQGNNECSHSVQIVTEQWGDTLHVHTLCRQMMSSDPHHMNRAVEWATSPNPKEKTVSPFFHLDEVVLHCANEDAHPIGIATEQWGDVLHVHSHLHRSLFALSECTTAGIFGQCQVQPKDLFPSNYFNQEGSDELRSRSVTEFSLGWTSLTQRQAS